MHQGHAILSCVGGREWQASTTPRVNGGWSGAPVVRLRALGVRIFVAIGIHQPNHLRGIRVNSGVLVSSQRVAVMSRWRPARGPSN